MSMGKNNRSPLSKLAAVSEYKPPERQPEVNVKKAHNGGYVVTIMGKEGYGTEKTHTYDDLSGVTECMEKHFGGKKEED